MTEKTLVNFILDETGSMQAMKDEVITGFNKYVEDLRRDEEHEYLFSLTKFDSTHSLQVLRQGPLDFVPPLTDENYQPGALTPLYDVMANAIKAVEVPPDVRVLTVVFTDGEENASQEWTLQALNTLIKERESWGWSFLYLGVSPEAWRNETIFDGTRSAANAFRSSGVQGMGMSLNAAASSTMSYAAGEPEIVTEQQKRDVDLASE